MESAQEGRHEPTDWETILLRVLLDEAQGHDARFDMTAPDILTALGIEGERQPAPKWLGDALSRYHLPEKRKRQWREGKNLTTYIFDPEALKKKCEIYLRIPPESSCSPVQDAESDENSDSYNEHIEKTERVHTCSKRENMSLNLHFEHERTCSGNFTCSPEVIEITENEQVEQVEHEKSGGIDNNFFHFFPEKEVDL